MVVITKQGEPGYLFTKPDMERCGLFSQMQCMNGKGYVSPFEKPVYIKGKNIIGEGPKIKTERQDCYFDKEFKRLFIKEAIKGRGRKEPPPRFKNISNKPFISPGAPKMMKTPGDYWGTFQGHVDAFSNRKRPKPPYKRELKNFIGGHVKMGNCGYADIGLNPYPSHSADRYGTRPKYKDFGHILDGPMVTSHYPEAYFQKNPFPDPPTMKKGPTYVKPKGKEKPFLAGKFMPTGPTKWDGGCKAGNFEKFPVYISNKYITYMDLIKPRKYDGGRYGKFLPHATGERTFYTKSVVNENLRFRFNSRTIDTIEPSFTKYLLD